MSPTMRGSDPYARRNIVVYISGPYSGEDELEVRKNIERADFAAQEVWKQGFTAICPHLNTALFGSREGPLKRANLTHSDYLAGDLSIVSRCDAVLTVGNYEESKGAKMEVAHALINGIPVFNNLNDLISWSSQVYYYYHKKRT